MSSLSGLALRLVSSSLTLLQSLVEGALGAAERACRSLPDSTASESTIVEGASRPRETSRHHGGSAIALERDAAARPAPTRPAASPALSALARIPQRAAIEPSPTLPRPADRERLVVLASAPGSVFAYWQVSQERRERVLAELGAPSEETQVILRVRLLQSASAVPEWRFAVPPRATSRHLDELPAGCLLEIALGIEAGDRFAILCPVVAVRTPSPYPLSSAAPENARGETVQRKPGEATSLRVLPFTGVATERVPAPSSAEWAPDAEDRRRVASPHARRPPS